MVVILLLLFLLAPCASSLSFSFPSFTNDDINNLSLEGDASLNGFLRLTKSVADQVRDQSVGRATYNQPFLLRDNDTGKLADFTTNFTFTIDSLGNTPYADGLVFFLVPNRSALNRHMGTGFSLGLPVINTDKIESTYPFVAVEFDIYSNNYASVQDPSGNHGWVIVGFSAATGAMTALQKINSWSFNLTSLIVEPGSGNGISIGLVVGQGGTGESSDNDEDPMINDPIDDEFEKGTGPKKFSYNTLAQSTNDFDENEKLGERGFGGVYRGFVKDKASD
ncbi:unnamed protein product [Prunus armeniaca]|uniref:Legume lectin domain-containing protein n=1 Tax=Prunus armeniaca TaxID=36596 RepID=A0A6J5X760_PRUAR|nr:unnamed protein product [Prunus armeniaca]